MKSSNSLQTIAIKKIKQLLEIFTPNLYIYLLSGTPFTAGFEDLYTQLSMLGMPMNKGQFMENFCIRGNIPTLPSYAQPVVDYKNIDQLFKIVHHYGITMKTEEVIKLPEKIFVNHILSRSKEMRLFSNEKLKCDEINKEFELRASTERVINENGDGKVNNPFFRNIDYPNLAWLGDTAANAWLRARQLSIGFQGNEEEAKWFHRARLNEVEKLLEEKPDNYILFYEYVPEFIELYEICDKLGYKIDVYNGLIKSLVFYEQFEKLSEGQKLVDKKRIILANYKSGSTGKNFQEYSKCILFNVPLFSDFEQGIKRINRIGQDQKTIYHMFYEDNWLDRSMLKSLNKKIDYDKNMFEKDLKESQDEI